MNSSFVRSYAGAPKAYTLQNGDTGTGTINLVFTPQYWFMNAIAKNTYVTKRYGVPATEGTGITAVDVTGSHIRHLIE